MLLGKKVSCAVFHDREDHASAVMSTALVSAASTSGPVDSPFCACTALVNPTATIKSPAATEVQVQGLASQVLDSVPSASLIFWDKNPTTTRIIPVQIAMKAQARELIMSAFGFVCSYCFCIRRTSAAKRRCPPSSSSAFLRQLPIHGARPRRVASRLRCSRRRRTCAVVAFSL
jgi:hypothetical protein